MTTQLAFDDLGVNPAHWHIVQGQGRKVDAICSNHIEEPKAQDQLSAWIAELEYHEGLEASALTADRADFAHGTDPDTEAWWLQIVPCDDWGCYKAIHDEEGNFQEYFA